MGTKLKSIPCTPTHVYLRFLTDMAGEVDPLAGFDPAVEFILSSALRAANCVPSSAIREKAGWRPESQIVVAMWHPELHPFGQQDERVQNVPEQRFGQGVCV